MSFFAPKSGRRWCSLLGIFLLAAALIQSVLYLTCFDGELGLYKQGFPVGLLTCGYLIAALLITGGVVCLPLLSIKKTSPELLCREMTDRSSPMTDFFALLTAVTIGATLITQLVRLNADDSLSIMLLSTSDVNSTARTMLILSLVLAIPALLYFIGFFARKKWAYPLVLTFLWVCAYMLRVYFDASILLMSPTRLLTIAALAMTVLFLLAELRTVRSLSSPIMYALTASLTALFAGVSGLGGLLLGFAGLIPIGCETPYYAFQLSVALFAFFRLRDRMLSIFTADRLSAKADATREEKA